MPDSHRLLKLALPLAFVVALSGCGDRTTTSDAGSVDSALAADLAMASQSDPSVTFADTALNPSSTRPARATRAPAQPATAPRPAPAPAPRPAPARPDPVPQAEVPSPAPTPAAQPEPARAGPGLAAGTAISLATNQQVCTDNRPGDKITATISNAIVGTDGVVIPAGAKAVLEVASTTHGTESGEPLLTFRVRAIIAEGRSWPVNIAVSTTPAPDKTRRNSAKSDRTKVIGGAVAGAVLGQVLGKDTKSTVIGAAAGAAAGAATAVATSHYVGCLASGSALTFTLAERVELASR